MTKHELKNSFVPQLITKSIIWSDNLLRKNGNNGPLIMTKVYKSLPTFVLSSTSPLIIEK